MWMMNQFFRVMIEKEAVIIKTCHDEDIIAKFNDTEVVFKNLNGMISIKLDQLQALVGQEHSGKVNLYYREIGTDGMANDVKIKIDNELTIDSSLMATFNERQWVFYVTTKGTFNCLFDKSPSSKSYLSDSHLEEIKHVGDDLQMQVSLTTKYLKAHDVTLIIRNRRTREEKVVSGKLTLLERNDSNYLQVLTIKMQLLSLYQLIVNQNSTVDSDKLDVYIRVKYLESVVADKDIRLKYSSEKESDYAKEIWIDNLGDLIYGFFPWSTKNSGNFSLQTTVLDEVSYKTYVNFTKIDKKPDNKKVFIVGETMETAQDNGFHFFKYVSEFYHDEIDCYFVVSEDSKDLGNLAGYENQILYKKSPLHIEKLLEADIIAHTHADWKLYPFISRMLFEKVQGKKVFLQHGIISVKSLGYIYGKDAYPFHTDYFVVSSEREKLLVINELGYSEEQVLLTGIPRFDQLLVRERGFLKNKIKKLITRKNLNLLIIPTYRREIKSEAEFIATEYYKGYQALINSEELSLLASKHSLKIQFYLHQQFQPFSKNFTSSFVNIVVGGDFNVQDLLKNNDLMITDYSSVGLDFSLMKKRVIYYQFDQIALEYAKNPDLENFLPGDIVHTEKEVLNGIKEFIKSNQKIKRKHKGKIRDLFLFMDKKSNQRLIGKIRGILD